MRSLVLTGMVLVGGCVNVVGPEISPENANVSTVTVSFALAHATLSGSVASQGYDVPVITPTVVDRGAVLAYFRDQSTWTALPFTVGIESSADAVVDYTFTMGYAYEDDFLEVFIEASTADEVVWTDIAGLLQEEYLIKVVVIDSYMEGLDVADYEAVRSFYGLGGP